jgi:hypothetical protein
MLVALVGDHHSASATGAALAIMRRTRTVYDPAVQWSTMPGNNLFFPSADWMKRACNRSSQCGVQILCALDDEVNNADPNRFARSITPVASAGDGKIVTAEPARVGAPSNQIGSGRGENRKGTILDGQRGRAGGRGNCRRGMPYLRVRLLTPARQASGRDS